MANKVQILIADDHPIVRQGLRHTIETEDWLEIVCETGTGEETLVAVRKYKPQIIILDINLPKMDGFEVMNALLVEKLDAKVIFLTVHREESFMRKALSLGGMGYVLKDCAVTDIIAALRAVSEGLPFVSPTMTAYLVKAQAAPGTENLDSLTPAERRVLRLIAQYKTTQEIADTLCVSRRTIESHRATITHKLGLRGSHSLMRYALQHLAEIERS